jgi:hypothetical protein
MPTVRELTGDRALGGLTAEAMLADNARAQKDTRPQGAHHSHRMMRQGETSSYFLRRLARDHGDILARYEGGEFKSVRAAEPTRT